MYITDDEATKELTEKIGKLEGEIKVKSDMIFNMTKQMEDIARMSSDRKTTIEKQSVEIQNLKTELEAEKAKPKQQEKKDIYDDEGKQGFFGSNLSNLWSKNKDNQ